MRYIFLLTLTFSTLAFSACRPCIACRERALANRPHLKDCFDQHRTGIDALDQVAADYQAGKYNNFLNSLLGQVNLNAPRFQRLLDEYKTGSTRSIRFFAFPSVLEMFNAYPEALAALRTERNSKLIDIADANPDHYLVPMLRAFAAKCPPPFYLDPSSTINQTFWLALNHYNRQALINKDTDLSGIAAYILAIDLRRLEKLGNTPLASILPKLTKLMRWESLLQIMGATGYKLDDEVELAVQQVQREFTEKWLELVQQRRELSVYR